MKIKQAQFEKGLGYRWVVALGKNDAGEELTYERLFSPNVPDGATEAEYVEDQLAELKVMAEGEAIALGIGADGEKDHIRKLEFAGSDLGEALDSATKAALPDREKRVEARRAARDAEKRSADTVELSSK